MALASLPLPQDTFCSSRTCIGPHILPLPQACFFPVRQKRGGRKWVGPRSKITQTKLDRGRPLSQSFSWLGEDPGAYEPSGKHFGRRLGGTRVGLGCSRLTASGKSR